MRGARHLLCVCADRRVVSCVADNGLSFIETSALDSSNVESAFRTILTGEQQQSEMFLYCGVLIIPLRAGRSDIYHIVSAKSAVINRGAVREHEKESEESEDMESKGRDDQRREPDTELEWNTNAERHQQRAIRVAAGVPQELLLHIIECLVGSPLSVARKVGEAAGTHNGVGPPVSGRIGQSRSRMPDVVCPHCTSTIQHTRGQRRNLPISSAPVCRSVCEAARGPKQPAVHRQRKGSPIRSSFASGCVAEVGGTRSRRSSTRRTLPSVTCGDLRAAPSFLLQRHQARPEALHFPLLVRPVAAARFILRLGASEPLHGLCRSYLRFHCSAGPIPKCDSAHFRG